MSDNVKVVCPQCQQKNADSVQYCTNCGYQFKSPKTIAGNSEKTRYASPSSAPKPSKLVQEVREVLTNAKDWLLESPTPKQGKPQNDPPQPPSQPTAATQPTQRSISAPTEKLSDSDISTITILAPTLIPEKQNIAGEFRNLKSIKLETCNYYEAIPVAQLQTGMLQPAPTRLIRETAKRPLHLPIASYQTLSNTQVSFILPHQQPRATSEKTYTVLSYPGAWGSLSKVKMPQSPEKAFAWTKQIGQALMSLNQAGVGGFWPGKEGREAIIIMQGEAHLADITFARPIDAQNFAKDVDALAGLFHYLLTGYELTPAARQAPPQFQAILRRAAGHDIPTISAFLQELETSKQTPVYQRALRQSPGYLTHQGKKREHNEDYVGVFQLALDQTGSAAPVGLYVVADGMGGQAAGEFASKGSVQQAFVQFINKQVLPDLQRSTRRLDTATFATPQEQLENLVQVANQLVFNANQSSNTNRGTTLTAALVIGDDAYIANVGDSRTYLLRNNQLQQITHDHSLVFSLFKAGQITEEEIYSHPRKNEIHRSIGDRAQVQVDTFSHSLLPGDKLLLCSDGLWEMVRNAPIQQILASTATPQAICDQLIRMANDNGGEDNITAIVVALE